MGLWVDGRWTWEFRCSRALLEEDLSQVTKMCLLIDDLVESGSEDSWCWTHDPARGYTVKGAYSILHKNLPLTRVWNSIAPPKVVAFG